MRNKDVQLPKVIYLPSSGGHGGSRISPELFTRRRFPFRRYSFQEDGSLVVRVGRPNQDERSHPYVKPVARSNTSPSHHASPLPDSEPTSIQPTSTSDPDRTVELLKSLVSAIVEDPTSFEQSIPSICAAHGIDKSVISDVTQAIQRKTSNPLLERTRALDQSTSSTTAPSHSAPTGSVALSKRERPFRCGSPGVTSWYRSHSLGNLVNPPPGLDPNVGDLYVHNNCAEASPQVWLCGLCGSWTRVDVADRIYHPVIPDRVLSMRASGAPSWITAASYTTIKGRKGKAKATE